MRIYSSANDPLDFCRKCALTEAEAEECFGNVGDGPDGRGNCFGYDCDHPPYEDDPDVYRCHDCGKVLTDRD